ncbi:hypothetical protein BBW65_02865 [Helicobacter enhydrae]|uniref:VTT domain-containing protein n=1 Tax=Helicobacter enhydrae TaxID=222136 RepID=A0A1B1U4Y2_9HELI|nr:DedA family protein [Helicobacter enhydrae]ANV97808.1 hypothetical protein BBW65_02865 [Helicobacter enhydrae]
MQDTLSNLETYGYILLFFSTFGGGIIPLICASVLAGIGKLDLFLCIVVAICGNFVGSLLLVYLARFQKKEFGAYFHKHRRKIAIAHIWLKRYGIWLFFINKFIYGFKTILPLAVGLSKYPIKVFGFFNLLAAILWAVCIGMLGYFTSHFIINLFEEWQEYSYLFPVLFVVVVLAIYQILKIKTKKLHSKNQSRKN